MSQIYVSGPWSFASGVQQVVKSIKAKSKGMLSELIWCINHRVPMFLAYKSANGLGIYTAEIDDNLTFKGIAGTADNFYQIINNQFGTIVAPNDTPGFVLSHQDTVLGSDCVYLKGEWIADPLDFLNVEQPKSYFYLYEEFSFIRREW